jgi:hypothetical protein
VDALTSNPGARTVGWNGAVVAVHVKCHAELDDVTASELLLPPTNVVNHAKA